ncbi:MAG TPA: hypothetical protein VJH03_10655 [Blastocatellia bacterium]|nr:hypothetical protein [Blastocatellia bacterium]
MKRCPTCSRSYPDVNRFCATDGTPLVEGAPPRGDDGSREARTIPPPPAPLPMRLTIVDQSDEGHRSRSIQGLVLDVGYQGMRVQTGTVETGQLNIIRDHTIAFKNKLDIEVELPNGKVNVTGFAAWYKPAGDGINWVAGVYIREMPAADRQIYDRYLQDLTEQQGGAAAEAV